MITVPVVNTIPWSIPRLVFVAEKEAIAEGLPLYIMFETKTPGPNKTFSTKACGLCPVLVVSCDKAGKVETNPKKTMICVNNFLTIPCCLTDKIRKRCDFY